MRVYLDDCSFNRPFDDQSQLRIRLEAEAKLYVQQKVREGKLELAWSYILDFENQANPFDERREAIQAWKKHAVIDTDETQGILAKAQALTALGGRIMITDTEIKMIGVKALTDALGEVNAEKFISLIMREPFDYTKWHRQLWDGRSVEDVSGSAMALRRSAST